MKKRGPSLFERLASSVGVRQEPEDMVPEYTDLACTITELYSFMAANDNGTDIIRTAEELLTTTEGYAYFLDIFAGHVGTLFVPDDVPEPANDNDDD